MLRSAATPGAKEQKEKGRQCQRRNRCSGVAAAKRRLPVRLYLELENYWKTSLAFAYLRTSSMSVAIVPARRACHNSSAVLICEVSLLRDGGGRSIGEAIDQDLALDPFDGSYQLFYSCCVLRVSHCVRTQKANQFLDRNDPTAGRPDFINVD